VVRKRQALLDLEESLDRADTSLVVVGHTDQVAHIQILVHLEDRRAGSLLCPCALAVGMEGSLVRMVVVGRMVVVDVAMVCRLDAVVVLTIIASD
jgi:hypothetical protein